MLFKLACYFPAENPLFIVVNLQSESWVQELSNAIAVELHSGGRTDVKLDDLRLFKTDVPLELEDTLQSRALQWLHEQPANSELDESIPLLAVFPNGPHPSKDMTLDIIVANAEVLEMVDDLGDPYYAYKRKVKKALNKALDSLSSLPLPLEAIKNSQKLAQVFGGEEPLIHIGRPGGAPAVIFNPILAALQQNLGNLDQVDVSEDEASLAASYIRCAVKFYDNEIDRQDAIKDLVDGAIGGTGELGIPLELKNSLGLGGDALSQAVVDYCKIVSRDQYKSFREHCNFPSVLIGITANRFEIAIIVCVGPIYMTKLLTLDLSMDFHASDNVIRLARVFKVLRRHRLELEEYYQSVKTSPPPKLSCLFPNPTLMYLSKPMPKLTYRKFFSRAGQPTPDILDLGSTTTAMYTAILDDTNEEVIVKFTARYNEAAHRFLAKAKLAPKLHFCGRVVGDLYMIVMEYVDGTSVWQLQKDKTPIPAVVATKVEEAVHLLHERGIVFGDLRINNILYVAAEPEAYAVLVDFDWPGEDGKSRYPATLNRTTVGQTWHADVSPYHIMHKAHDLWLLEQLKALCKSNND